jgi:ribosomal protein S18 acetylase RimI-like enzyme
MNELLFRPLVEEDREWVSHFMIDHWGADVVVVHETKYWPAECPGFTAEDQGRVVGLITYHINGLSCEIITLDSLEEGRGIGSKLINLVIETAMNSGCRRLWLVTTNNNTHALRFYQKYGFRLNDIRVGAVDEARKIKPEIPLLDADGIPIRDELELEIIL